MNGTYGRRDVLCALVKGGMYTNIYLETEHLVDLDLFGGRVSMHFEETVC